MAVPMGIVSALLLLLLFVHVADALPSSGRLPPIYDGAVLTDANGAQSLDRQRCGHRGTCDTWIVKVR